MAQSKCVEFSVHHVPPFHMYTPVRQAPWAPHVLRVRWPLCPRALRVPLATGHLAANEPALLQQRAPGGSNKMCGIFVHSPTAAAMTDTPCACAHLGTQDLEYTGPPCPHAGARRSPRVTCRPTRRRRGRCDPRVTLNEMCGIFPLASPLKTRKLGGGDGPRGFLDVLLTVYTAGLRYTEHCGHPRVPGGRGAALMAVCWPR